MRETANMRKLFSHVMAACLCAGMLMASVHSARAEDVLMAVAANFAEAAEKLARAFEKQTGHKIRLTAGSTGKLYAQIINGAPYDIFLAADQARPGRLEAEGRIVPGSRFTYATGKLSLWSANAATINPDGPDASNTPEILKMGRFRNLAIANPRLAPYGLAAQSVLENLGLWQQLQDKIVMGQNAGQTFAMIASGNAELGFAARSHCLSPRNTATGSRWDVPAHLHAPIRQDAVLIARASENSAAIAFMRYLKSDQAAKLIRPFGYGVD